MLSAFFEAAIAASIAGESGVLHVLRHDEGVDRVLGVRDRLEIDVADPAVDLLGQTEELVADAEVERQRSSRAASRRR